MGRKRAFFEVENELLLAAIPFGLKRAGVLSVWRWRSVVWAQSQGDER